MIAYLSEAPYCPKQPLKTREKFVGVALERVKKIMTNVDILQLIYIVSFFYCYTGFIILLWVRYFTPYHWCGDVEPGEEEFKKYDFWSSGQR